MFDMNVSVNLLKSFSGRANNVQTQIESHKCIYLTHLLGLWLQEIVWLIWNDVDIERANQTSVWDRIPLIESDAPPRTPGLQATLAQSQPTLVKTPLPVKFWQKTIDKSAPKTIHIMRNAKDQYVSYYHLVKIVFM